MKQKFREVRLSKDNKNRLEMINSIIGEYKKMDLILTLRQLYYQLVSRDVIPNQQKEYAKLSGLLKEGRMGGIVDWDAIEDRLRRPDKNGSWDSAKDIVLTAASAFQLPRMKGQNIYTEVWVEKDALSGVLKQVTGPFHVNLMVNRGYSSASAMYDSYQRFTNAIEEGANQIKILYLGDFDPSGKDMIRDVRDRISEFLNGDDEIVDRFSDADEFFSIEPIALTWDQITEYNPPPNPAKITDPRAAKYIEEFGEFSWEVDALKPELLHGIVNEGIMRNIDYDQYKDIMDQEAQSRTKIRQLAKQL